jgi:hypothetical protein
MESDQVDLWYSKLPRPLRDELRTGEPGDSRISSEIIDAVPAEHASDSEQPWFAVSTTSFGGVSDVTYRAVDPLRMLMARLRRVR